VSELRFSISAIFGNTGDFGNYQSSSLCLFHVVQQLSIPGLVGQLDLSRGI